MAPRSSAGFSRRSLRLLAALQAGGALPQPPAGASAEEVESLAAADLIERRGAGLGLTAAGRAFLARRQAAQGEGLDPFLAQHLDTAGAAQHPKSADRVLVDHSESPLAWLARRKGRDGQPLIAPEQFQAGERLRAEFTRAQLTPRITASWSASVAAGARDGGGAASFSDTVIAARQRVRLAVEAVGPEFSGLLLDVCCFLKGLEDVERERSWPARSGKVVLQLGLERLARHYGLTSEARGRSHAPIRTWLAEGEAFVVDGT